jgi:Ca-activated chloride channel family protein
MQEVEDEVTKLGLEYNLLTNYTSFVAIDSEVRNQGGQATTVRQPLPLPEGVSNYAVGGVAASPCFRNSADPNKDRSYEVMQEVAYGQVEPEVFTIVESMPEFPGGESALENFLKNNIFYPKAARENHIQGTVYITFVVEKDGSLSDIKVLRGIGGGCDEEALRVVKLMPKWIPGKQNGKAVKVQYTLAVRFNPDK